jgi:hypothetical protein
LHIEPQFAPDLHDAAVLADGAHVVEGERESRGGEGDEGGNQAGGPNQRRTARMDSPGRGDGRSRRLLVAATFQNRQ